MEFVNFVVKSGGVWHNVAYSTGSRVSQLLNIESHLVAEDVYFTKNGRLVNANDELIDGATYHIVPRLQGGKGGFGSMLRAIGAQIEKTTNREACRDLSGRRMRDINNEKQLRDWVGKQADREREKEEKRKERIERRRAVPKHNFDDPEYHEQKKKVLDNLDDAIHSSLAGGSGEGTSTGGSTVSRKRKATSAPAAAAGSKRSAEWLGVDLDDSDLSTDDSSEESDIDAQTGSSSSHTSSTGRQPEGTDHHISGKPEGTDDTTSKQADGADHSTSEQPEGTDHSISGKPEGADGTTSKQAEGTDHSTSEQPEGTDHSISGKPEGADGTTSKQAEGTDHSTSEQPEGTDHSISEQPEGADHSTSELPLDTKLPNPKHQSHPVLNSIDTTNSSEISNGINRDKEENEVTMETGDAHSDDGKKKEEYDGNDNAKFRSEILIEKEAETVMKSEITSEAASSSAVQETRGSTTVETPALPVMSVEEVHSVESISALEALGLEGLKCTLVSLGLKCGGTLAQRAERLWAVRGLPRDKWNPSLLAKPSKRR